MVHWHDTSYVSGVKQTGDKNMSNATKTDRIVASMNAREYRKAIAQHMTVISTVETTQDMARAARRAEFARIMGQRA